MIAQKVQQLMAEFRQRHFRLNELVAVQVENDRVSEQDANDVVRKVVEYLSENPADTRAWLHLAVYSQLGNDDVPITLDLVEDILRTVCTLDDDNPDVAVELGYFVYALLDQPSEAVQHFDEAMNRLMPTLRSCVVGKLKALSESGQEAECSRLYEQYLPLFAKDDHFINWNE